MAGVLAVQLPPRLRDAATASSTDRSTLACLLRLYLATVRYMRPRTTSG